VKVSSRSEEVSKMNVSKTMQNDITRKKPKIEKISKRRVRRIEHLSERK